MSVASIRAERVAGFPTIRVLQLIALALLLAIWEVIGSVAPEFYSQPTSVVSAIGAMVASDDLVWLTLTTLGVLAVGLALAFGIGAAVGLLAGRYRVVEVILGPYMAALYAVPRVAFVPLMVIWFGIGQTFIVASVIIAVAVQVAMAMANGVREIGNAYYEVAQSLGIGGRDFVLKILLPGSVPYLATGLRLGVERGLMAVIVAQYLVGIPGLGTLINLARTTLQPDRMFGIAIVCMVVGLLLISVTTIVERRLSRWRPEAF